MVLEKIGEDQMDRLSEKLWKWRSIPNTHERKRYPGYTNKKKANWIFHILLL